MDGSYFWFPRALLTDPVFRRDGAMGEREAWVWLIAGAAPRTGPDAFGALVDRGQMRIAPLQLARQWGWTVSHVGRFLARLAENGLIRLEETVLQILEFDSMTVAESEEPREACVELLSPSDLDAQRVFNLTAKRPTIPAAVRQAVIARDGNACRYCLTTSGPFHFDHVVPWSRGGLNTAHNIVVACAPCNMSKGARTPAEWRSA